MPFFLGYRVVALVCGSFAIALFASVGAHAQPRAGFVSSAPVAELLQRFRDPLLIETNSYRREELSNALRWLLNAKVPDQVPDSLLRGLSTDYDVLRSRVADERLKQLAIDDLILKGTFCRRSPDSLGAAVDVSVRTLLKDAEHKGWEVVYTTAVEGASDAIRPDGFVDLSSPTTRPFTAGRFLVWARDPSNPQRRGEARELIVNGTKREVGFVVFVPGPK